MCTAAQINIFGGFRFFLEQEICRLNTWYFTMYPYRLMPIWLTLKYHAASSKPMYFYNFSVVWSSETISHHINNLYLKCTQTAICVLLVRCTVQVSERVRFWNENVHLSANHSPSCKKRWAVIGWGVYIFMPKSYTFRDLTVYQGHKHATLSSVILGMICDVGASLLSIEFYFFVVM